MIGVWVVGSPGCGKTTMLRNYIDPFDTEFVVKPKWTLTNNIILSGHYLGKTFDGGDTVPYNAFKESLQYWSSFLLANEKYSVTIFDGDRFSTKYCLEYVNEFADGCFCILIDLPNDVLVERRKERGSNQNANWLKGRETKAKNFFNMFKNRDRLILDGKQSPKALSEIVIDWINTNARTIVETE
ncbi:MAG TPA: hypothetical protein EYN67_06785 [Flavobacteriales bacterium]|nr:hypothetical protein [Flavobacteriales bacterium]